MSNTGVSPQSSGTLLILCTIVELFVHIIVYIREVCTDCLGVTLYINGQVADCMPVSQFYHKLKTCYILSCSYYVLSEC